MGSVRIELNGDGIRELLGSDGVQAMLTNKAEAVAEAARSRGITVGPTGDGSGEVRLPIEAKATGTAARARAIVVSDHPAALAVEAKHRLLGGSLDAAR